MKIKTITCHHAINHGAMLQAYALSTFLRMQGHDVEIIDYVPSYLQLPKLFQGDPRYDKIGLGWLYALAKFPYRAKFRMRAKAFDEFFVKYLPTTKTHYTTIEELRKNPPKADCYIAGSDQIWNTTFQNGKDPAFYLDFGNANIKRISYAASFATPSIDEKLKGFVREQLNKFDHIAVREASGVKILKSLGINGELVVDPVFLLSPNDWNRIADKAVFQCTEDYILIYDFMSSQSIKNIAKRLAHLYNCQIYSVSPDPLNYTDKNFIYLSPTEFVALVKHARCVISNSFHGTAFSMIFQRDFFIVEREDGLNDRMKDLLKRYGIPERLINCSVNNKLLQSSIDYSNVNVQIDADVASSKMYLTECLK